MKTRDVQVICGGAFMTSLLSLSCGDPLKQPQLLEEARVLGVKVASDGNQSSIVSGMPFDVDVLLAGPEGPIEARVALRVCAATSSDRGVPACREDPFGEVLVGVTELPLTFSAPTDLTPGSGVAVLGIACESSLPVLTDDPISWSCDGGGKPLRFSFEALVFDGEERRDNPDVSELSVHLEAETLLFDDPWSEPLCGTNVPNIRPGATAQLTISLAGAFDPDDAVQLSHFATRGELERSYSFPESSREVRIEWKAGAEEEPVKHYLVLRDGRGGSSWVSWSMCQQR